MMNVPTQDVSNFADVLNYATVLLTSKEEAAEYNNCKEEIDRIMSIINTPVEVVLSAENSVVRPKQMVFSKLG